MTTREIYVCDTCCLISYYRDIFEPLGAVIQLSNGTRSLIDNALDPIYSHIKISIPSVVFCEIYDKWLHSEEITKQFYYEAFLKLSSCPNIEIKSIEHDVLINIITIGQELNDHEIIDKIIVASALELDCPLITTDETIISYHKNQKRIPRILN
jgi:PIN domain nuclease of toxin-antitoxin system